jgi:RNase P/RNase MRP subunit POP5
MNQRRKSNEEQVDIQIIRLSGSIKNRLQTYIRQIKPSTMRKYGPTSQPFRALFYG